MTYTLRHGDATIINMMYCTKIPVYSQPLEITSSPRPERVPLNVPLDMFIIVSLFLLLVLLYLSKSRYSNDQLLRVVMVLVVGRRVSGY